MEIPVKRYVIQSRKFDWDPWTTRPGLQFDTLQEAKEAFEALPIKHNHRIAEAYPVVRYKAVKA